ncbi:MAG: hypothetical protein Q9161_005090 [Pseudevernia consocians]
MKSPPTSGSSGSSTGSKKVASQHTGSGVKKSATPMKKSGKSTIATGGEILRGEKKWQAFFDSADDINADDEKVRTHLFESLSKYRAKKLAENSSSANAGECLRYDVKGLMAQIYQDLHRVAGAQGPKIASGGAQTERVFLGELSENILLLREVSVGVETVIKSALAHLYKSEHPQSSEILDIHEKISRCLSYEDPASERYGNLAAHHSWKFLSKLAHSGAFRNAAYTLDASTWQLVSSSIDENAVSLMVFTECHALDWWTELIHLRHLFPPTPSYDFSRYQPAKPPKPSPHKWVVTPNLSDVHRPTFEGKTQLNIPHNIYRARAFASTPPPPSWPPSRPYPEDPTQLRPSSAHSCLACHSHTPCTCTMSTSPTMQPPLVELHRYGNFGVGVRALSRIPAHAIIGEYVGEVFPAAHAGDAVYALDFSLPGRAADEVLATISAKRLGNWTRFLNHSCAAATRFRNVTVGGRHRMVVQAVREIEVFEEVTVDYGVGYWRDRVCGCGVEGCCSEGK